MKCHLLDESEKLGHMYVIIGNIPIYFYHHLVAPVLQEKHPKTMPLLLYLYIINIILVRGHWAIRPVKNKRSWLIPRYYVLLILKVQYGKMA